LHYFLEECLLLNQREEFCLNIQTIPEYGFLIHKLKIRIHLGLLMIVKYIFKRKLRFSLKVEILGKYFVMKDS